VLGGGVGVGGHGKAASNRFYQVLVHLKRMQRQHAEWLAVYPPRQQYRHTQPRPWSWRGLTCSTWAAPFVPG
jgi:hypothetical protein